MHLGVKCTEVPTEFDNLKFWFDVYFLINNFLISIQI